jgi:hypothetical protein
MSRLLKLLIGATAVITISVVGAVGSGVTSIGCSVGTFQPVAPQKQQQKPPSPSPSPPAGELVARGE